MKQYSKDTELQVSIKTKIIEIQYFIKENSKNTFDATNLLNKLKELIESFTEFEKNLDEIKIQCIERELKLKEEIKRINTKLEMKELECQELNDELKQLIGKIKNITKERFTEIKNRVLECMKCKNSDRSKEKLEMIAYKLNYFLQNDEHKSISSKTEIDNDHELKKKLAEKYQKELNQLSLSQREKLVFNYIHQPGAQENLGDVCLDDLLKITSRSNTSEHNDSDQSDKLIRINKCKSAKNFGKYSEFCDSEEDETEEIIERSSSSSYENNNNIKILDENKEESKIILDSLLDKLEESGRQIDTIKDVIEIKQNNKVFEKDSTKDKDCNENVKEMIENEKPYEDQSSKVKTCASHKASGLPIKRARRPKLMIFPNSKHRPLANESFIVPKSTKCEAVYPFPQRITSNPNTTPRNDSKSVIVPGFTQDKSVIPSKRNPFQIESISVPNSQCRSLQKLSSNPIKNIACQNESRPVIISKNYGNQHNEVNVNISIMDSKLRNQLLKQHMPELIAPKMPIPLNKLNKNLNKISARSFSVKNNYRQRNAKPNESIEQKFSMKNSGQDYNVISMDSKMMPNIGKHQGLSKNGLKLYQKHIPKELKTNLSHSSKAGNISLPIGSFNGCKNKLRKERGKGEIALFHNVITVLNSIITILAICPYAE